MPTAVVARKVLAPTLGPAMQETLYTVTAEKMLAANLVIRNMGSVAKKVAVAITDNAAARRVALLGPVTSGTVIPRLDLSRSMGDNTTALLISKDRRSWSSNGGLTWAPVVFGVYYGLTGSGANGFKMVYAGPDRVEIYPCTSGIVFGTFNANAIGLTRTGVGTLFLANPIAFLDGIETKSTILHCFWPSSSTQVTRLYNSSTFTTDSGRSLTDGGSGTLLGSNLNSIVYIDNATASYSGVLDLAASTNNYHYYTANNDTTPTAASVTSPVVTDGTTVVRIDQCNLYALVTTANGKTCVVSKYPTGTASPTISALSALPGGLAAADIESIWCASNTLWVIRSTTGRIFRGAVSSPTWVESTGIVVPEQMDSLTGLGQLIAAPATPTEYVGSSVAGYINETFSTPQGVRIGSTWYEIDTVLENTSILESHDLVAGATLELSGRVFNAGTVIKVLSQDSDLSGVGATLYGIES